MLDHDRLLTLLAEVRTGDESNAPMSNGLLVEHLGWSPSEVAESLATARARMLVWGLRCSGEPRPQFNVSATGEN